MSHNCFGHLFRFTTWGESHGPAIGCVVDGVPPHLPLSEADIQIFLDKRRPGQSRHTTQRREPDEVKILSGVFDGVTTGTALSLMIENVDQRSRDYSEIMDKFRPGHADFDDPAPGMDKARCRRQFAIGGIVIDGADRAVRLARHWRAGIGGAARA